MVNEFQPNLINWWSISGITKAILSIPKFRHIPDVFWVDDDWIIEERARGELEGRPLWSNLWRSDNKPGYWQPFLIWLMEKWKKH